MFILFKSGIILIAIKNLGRKQTHILRDYFHTEMNEIYQGCPLK